MGFRFGETGYSNAWAGYLYFQELVYDEVHFPSMKRKSLNPQQLAYGNAHYDERIANASLVSGIPYGNNLFEAFPSTIITLFAISGYRFPHLKWYFHCLQRHFLSRTTKRSCPSGRTRVCLGPAFRTRPAGRV
ncbi:hypothetical protein CEXT_815641 [Caerostris extrusa]|uniref:Uncharacterized protein n=1 Tax=Caerostris extrusa TaxID=172846 RepID=A0AAV4S5G9_CAEEX|nr:hypothetical protein CEXT_815641 [Caerostris extrusa]